MSITFIDKYKPHNFDKLIIDDEFKYLLQNSVKHDILNILFVGDIGCGKTTIINCILNEYYQSLKYSKNILYINNLKEQGIHTFRQEIKTFIQTASQFKDKKKFIIVDDIDNLNEQTQQILRNAIDNYSHKINFIASCYNLQKVIDNIQSRLNIYRIHLPNYVSLTSLYNLISKEENILLDKDIQDYIIKSSNNSYRILINHLQKINLLKESLQITSSNINEICCNIKFIDFDNIINSCKTGNFKKAKDIILNILNDGYSIIDIYEFFFNYIKYTTLLDDNIKFSILPLICKYISIFHTIHEDNIEIELFIYDLYILLKKYE